MPLPRDFFFHHSMHMHSYSHFVNLNSLLQICVLSLSSSLSRARRAGLHDLVNQHEFKERSVLLLGAFVVPNAVTYAFCFVLLHVFCG